MLTLNNGQKIPSFGLGTYKITGSEGITALKSAIHIGYRMFDTAFVYGNECTLGQALREVISEGIVVREELFIISKLGPCHQRPELVEKGCRLSLERLGLDYLDLYLIHTPIALKYRGDAETRPMNDNGKLEFDDELVPATTWKALEDCQRKGLVRSIGVSNFNAKQLDEVINNGRIKPVVNQVECSIGFNQADMRRFCKKEGILVMAYSPLGKPKPEESKPDFLHSAALLAMVEKYGKTAAQIALRYLVEIEAVPIPKSSNETRMKENFEVFNFKIEQSDIDILESLVDQKRSMQLEWLKESKHYPFK